MTYPFCWTLDAVAHIGGRFAKFQSGHRPTACPCAHITPYLVFPVGGLRRAPFYTPNLRLKPIQVNSIQYPKKGS